METKIVIVEVSETTDGRRVLEDIENQVFENDEAVFNAILKEEPNAHNTQIVSLTDFMDMCNNSDDMETLITLDYQWIGYVQIKE